MFLDNISCATLWERAIADWIGVFGRVKHCDFRIMNFHAEGDVIHTHGTVSKVWQEKGQDLVLVQMFNENP